MPKTDAERKAELKVWFFEFLEEYQSKGFLQCPSCEILFKPTKYPGCPTCGAKYDVEKKQWLTKESEQPDGKDKETGDGKDKAGTGDEAFLF